MKFDDWWKGHRHLFLDRQPAVRLIKSNRFKLNPECIYLELNLKRTPTSIMHLVRFHLRTRARDLKRGKNKTSVQTIFAFTPQAEIRPTVYVDYLRFLKIVYAPNCSSRPIELRKIAQDLFRDKRRTIPSLNLDKDNDGESIAYISVNRYRRKAIALCRAVANGEFPGKA
jgi:hypothetical protein